MQTDRQTEHFPPSCLRGTEGVCLIKRGEVSGGREAGAASASNTLAKWLMDELFTRGAERVSVAIHYLTRAGAAPRMHLLPVNNGDREPRWIAENGWTSST